MRKKFRHPVTLWGLAAVTLLLMAFPARGGVLLTVDEALRLAFPDCQITRKTVYLTRNQLAQAASLSDVETRSALVNPYVATKNGRIVGVAYFDVHTVRTLTETLMIVIDAENRIQRIEIIAFHEPREYLPRPAWLQQFAGQQLDDELALKRKIRNMTGATLTARAVTDAIRRVMALHLTLKGTLIP
ncbi:MAG: FMN-binding protein [candidate division Zixibacteria bacterium]|nr:FMN-binding protein [candidate division Zixibacteria bacterium]